MSSKVWKYYKKKNEKAHCTICPQILACKGSSTSSLKSHLIRKHQIDLNDKKTSEQNMSVEEDKPSSSQAGVKKYFNKVNSNLSLDEILSRAVAEDGFSINSVCKSKLLKSYLKSLKMEMPSQMTAWKQIYSFYEQKKIEYINIFEKILIEGGKFSIIVDEWVDVSAYKYINVSVRGYNPNSNSLEVFNLGLQQITTKGTAENIEKCIKEKLTEFKINLDTDVVASTHDGAAVMKKYGESISPISQLCYNHSIHLCVVDSFYKQSNKVDLHDTSWSDMESEYSDSEDSVDINSIQIELLPSILTTVSKVRKVVKMFKRSQDKQQKLQSYVTEQEGHQIHLKLDVKHRWNSLSQMIGIFLKLKICINHTLLDLNLETFSEAEFKVLESVFKDLEPLCISVNKLSSDSVTLLEADVILKFVLSAVGKSNTIFSKTLHSCLHDRIFQRRNIILNTLILYLHNGYMPKSCKYLKYSTKSAAIDLAVKLYNRLFFESIPDNIILNNTSDSECVEISTSSSLEEQLNITLKSIQNPIFKHQTVKNNNLTDDFDYLEKFKKRRTNLNLLIIIQIEM
ncbi:hypothetical protein CVS40_12692 [Lucilia cuprina]|nr:hypothetical protein CVS40_12692 [Lucilia cuprina]